MKNVLIIGGSTDIGLNLAMYFNNHGYNVIATYHNHKIENDKIEYLKCDVRDEDNIDKVIKYTIDKYGKDIILINMAAISMDSYFQDKTKEEFMNVLEINLVGTFLTSKIYSKYIENGLIVNISSTDGIYSYNSYNMDYSASKAGVISLTKSISLSTSNKVICIAPNWIDSDTTRCMDKEYLNNELKRIGESRLITKEELSTSIYNIINDNTITGSIYIIDVKDDKLWIKKM